MKEKNLCRSVCCGFFCCCCCCLCFLFVCFFVRNEARLDNCMVMAFFHSYQNQLHMSRLAFCWPLTPITGQSEGRSIKNDYRLCWQAVSVSNHTGENWRSVRVKRVSVFMFCLYLGIPCHLPFFIFLFFYFFIFYGCMPTVPNHANYFPWRLGVHFLGWSYLEGCSNSKNTK